MYFINIKKRVAVFGSRNTSLKSLYPQNLHLELAANVSMSCLIYRSSKTITLRVAHLIDIQFLQCGDFQRCWHGRMFIQQNNSTKKLVPLLKKSKVLV